MTRAWTPDPACFLAFAVVLITDAVPSACIFCYRLSNRCRALLLLLPQRELRRSPAVFRPGQLAFAIESESLRLLLCL
jgi:hypothetical protein